MVDIGEVEREFQADMPPLEPLDMNMEKRAKTFLFSTAKELAKGNRRRAAPSWSAPAELFLFVHHHLNCRWDPDDSKALGWKKSRKQQRNAHVRRGSWFLFWYTHREHSIHHDGHTHHSRSMCLVERSFRVNGEGNGR